MFVKFTLMAILLCFNKIKVFTRGLITNTSIDIYCEKGVFD